MPGNYQGGEQPPPHPPYHPPVKRSVEIAGHKTSISLEPLFWAMLKDAAVARRLPINALVAAIDAERLATRPVAGLASAVRVWLVVEHGGPPARRDEAGETAGADQ